MTKKFEIEKDFHNARFDRWFKNKVLDIPQGLIEKIIRKNQAKVNGKKTKSSYRVQENDIIEIYNLEKVKKTEPEMLRTPNFGRKSLNEIKEVLSTMSLYLGMEIPNWPPDNIAEMSKKLEENTY